MLACIRVMPRHSFINTIGSYADDGIGGSGNGCFYQSFLFVGEIS
tara:strand:+ start:384 stop:518 length:135 start_codon:yes stop_codon:yes gene_type:complete